MKTGSQAVWRLDQLEKRCGRESQHPAEGALRPPIEQFGNQSSWWDDAGLRNMSQRGWAPRPPFEQPRRTGKNAVMANRMGVYMLQFCSVSNSLSHTTHSIKWEVYFSREMCRSSLLCCRYDSACICRCICIMCLYSWSCSWLYHIYPTPPLGQDMTQGQFF